MQLEIKKMKPIRIVGDSVTARPSSDIKESCCVRRPKPSPASKLNEGPAKQAAILGRFQEKEKGISILSEIVKRIGKKTDVAFFPLTSYQQDPVEQAHRSLSNRQQSSPKQELWRP